MAHHRTGVINACRSETQPQTQYKAGTQGSRYFSVKVARNRGTKSGNHDIEAIKASGSHRQPAKRRHQKTSQTHHSAIICALCIAAAIAFHAQEGVQQLMEDPARICIWSLCFLPCLIYHKKRSSYRVAAEHTVLPPLTVILLVTGYFPDVAMFLIIVTIITSIITARSLKIGILRAGTTLAPIPLIKILFANTSHVLSIIISQNSVNAAINPYQFQHWLLPLLIMTVAVPIIRLICDIVTFFFVQIPIRKAMREYSLSHILAMALADLMAIVWIPEILEFANIGSDTATVLSVFMLALIATRCC